ncbi:unnamed protein product [Sphagnum tenellum]
MLLREARKEGKELDKKEGNTHHSSKDNKSFVRVPEPITTKPTDRENNSSEHRPGNEQEEKTYLDCYASEVVFKLDARENSATIRDLHGDEDDRRHKTLSHATLQQQERQQQSSPHPAFIHPVTLPCPLFRRATL